jgi:hypothetical protein
MRRLCVARASRLVQTVAQWHGEQSNASQGGDGHRYGGAAIENGTSMWHHSRESGYRLAYQVPSPIAWGGRFLLCTEEVLRLS